MSKFQVKTQEMCYFLNVSDKTVYNYRTLDYEDLPIKVKNHFFNFFMVGSFESIYETCNKMNSDEIIELSDRFFRFANVRNNLKESGAFSNIINNPNSKVYLTTSNDIKKMDDFNKKMDDLEFKEKERESSRGNRNSPNRITTMDNSANQINPNAAYPYSELVSKMIHSS